MNYVLDPALARPSTERLRARNEPESLVRDKAAFDCYLYAQENERLRIGRELHDSTGQLLVTLSLNLATLRAAQSCEQTEAILEEISQTVNEIDQEIRTFAFLNYPTDLDDRGLVSALDMLCRGFAKRTGLRVSFRGTCQQPISDALALAFLRIAQEALTNILRHAHAANVKVSLSERQNGLELAISDDGIGIATKAVRDISGGIGIHGMRHRIEKLGGRFEIRPLKHGAKIVAAASNKLRRVTPITAG